jgi:hypothetical protein
MILELTRGRLKVGQTAILHIRGLIRSTTIISVIILLSTFYFYSHHGFSVIFYLIMILAMFSQTALSVQRGAFGRNQQWKMLFLQLAAEGLGKILLVVTLPNLHLDLFDTLVVAHYLPALPVYLIFKPYVIKSSGENSTFRKILSDSVCLPAIWLENAAIQCLTFLPILVVANTDSSRVVEATRFALLVSLMRIPLSFMPVLIAPMLASRGEELRIVNKKYSRFGLCVFVVLCLPVGFFLQRYAFAFIYPDLVYESNWRYIGLDLAVFFLAGCQFYTGRLVLRSMFNRATFVWLFFF